MVAGPSAATLAAVTVAPAVLGLWKSEYGVSYAYGTATMVGGGLMIGAAGKPLGAAHALCIALYGADSHHHQLHAL